MPMVSIILSLLLALPALAQNREHTATLPGGVAIELVWIDAGSFAMGAPPPDPDDDDPPPRASDQLPDHRIIFGEGFWLGKFELTQAQWTAVMGTHPWRDLPSARDAPDYPAVFLTWDDAQSFVQTVNRAIGDSLYRLPTEAEWEYACRAGTQTRWSHGDRETTLDDYAWFEKNAWDQNERYAHPVGRLLPNPWGLYDMHGNAEEWVQDFYSATYYDESPEHDPPGPDRGRERVLRGGNYADPAEWVRSSHRNKARADFVSGRFGLRLLARATLPTAVERKTWGQLKGIASESPD